MLDPNLSEQGRRDMVRILSAGLNVDLKYLRGATRGPQLAKKTLLGRFELDDGAGQLHVSNIAREADRITINGCEDGGFWMYWERDGKFARVYYDPDKSS